MADQRTDVAGGLPCETLVMRLYYLDQLLVRVLQQLFSRPQENLVPALQHLYWVPDSADGASLNDPRAIRIEHWARWNPANVGNLPAISVRANDVGFIKVGITNLHSSPGVFNPSGEEFYTKAVTGSHRLMCISRDANEAQLLGLTVADHVQAFSRQICKAVDLKVLEVASVGAPKKIRELPHTFGVPVNIEYGCFQTWAVTPAAPRLNRVRFQVSTEAC